MRAGQTLYDDDNNQVCLFPLEYMNISQGEGGSYSHSGTYAVDFLGWGPNGRVYECPCYAPVDIKCVYAPSSNTYRIYESLNKVHFADGSLDYLTIWFNHGNHNANIHVGDIFPMGTKCNETGVSGQVTGDHSHIICGKGKYTGQKQVNGNWTLKNQVHIYNALFVNDTVLVNDYNYNWKTFEGGNPNPPSMKKYRFKWVLYANKFRNRNLTK